LVGALLLLPTNSHKNENILQSILIVKGFILDLQSPSMMNNGIIMNCSKEGKVILDNVSSSSRGEWRVEWQGIGSIGNTIPAIGKFWEAP